MLSAIELAEYVYCWRVGAMIKHHIPCCECGQKCGHGGNVPWNMCFLCGTVALHGTQKTEATTGDIVRCACSEYTVTDDGMSYRGASKPEQWQEGCGYKC
jgi:hypothetical protein